MVLPTTHTKASRKFRNIWFIRDYWCLTSFWSFEGKTYTWSSPKSSHSWNPADFTGEIDFERPIARNGKPYVFHVCKNPCDIRLYVTSQCHVNINCNSMRFTVHKLSIQCDSLCANCQFLNILFTPFPFSLFILTYVFNVSYLQPRLSCHRYSLPSPQRMLSLNLRLHLVPSGLKQILRHD